MQWSPWPSLPNKPSPHVKSLPSLPMAAAWYGPQDTWDTLQQHNRHEAQDASASVYFLL